MAVRTCGKSVATCAIPKLTDDKPGFCFKINVKQGEMNTTLIQKAIVISYISTLLISSLLCCWTTNLQQQRLSKQHVITFDPHSQFVTHSMILKDGKGTSPTKRLRSTEREKTSQQLRRSVGYLAITLLLAGDVHQNPGPNSSCSGGPQLATASTGQDRPTVDFKLRHFMTEMSQQSNPACSILTVPANVRSVLTTIPKVRDEIPIHKQRNFLLFQTTNHAKVLWVPRAKPKGLLGGHLNIRRVASKTDQLEKLLMDSNQDFLFLSESWLTVSSLDTVYLVPGYNIFRKDQNTGRGGGLLMYVKDCINCNEI